MLTDPIESRSIRTNEYNTTKINGQLRKTPLTHLERLWFCHSLENHIKSTSGHVYLHLPPSFPSQAVCHSVSASRRLLASLKGHVLS